MERALFSQPRSPHGALCARDRDSLLTSIVLKSLMSVKCVTNYSHDVLMLEKFRLHFTYKNINLQCILHLITDPSNETAKYRLSLLHLNLEVL